MKSTGGSVIDPQGNTWARASSVSHGKSADWGSSAVPTHNLHTPPSAHLVGALDVMTAFESKGRAADDPDADQGKRDERQDRRTSPRGVKVFTTSNRSVIWQGLQGSGSSKLCVVVVGTSAVLGEAFR